MEPDVQEKLDAIYRSVEKTRNYFKWTLIVTLIVIFLPLLGLLFVIPTLFHYYQSLSNIGLF